MPIFVVCVILLSISIVANAEKYEFGNYNVSFRYPTPVINTNNSTSYENDSIIYCKRFVPFLEIARPFFPLLGFGQSGEVEAIDLESFEICLYEMNGSIQGDVSSKIDHLVMNNSTLFETWTGSLFAAKTMASKVDRPYQGLIMSSPLENGLSINMYMGVVNNLTVIGVVAQCPPESFTEILSTLKVTPKKNLVANESQELELVLPKVELPNQELPNQVENMLSSWKSISFLQIAPIVIGIITIIITIYVYIRSRKRKSLGYELLAEASLLTVSKDIHKKIKIYFEENAIQDAWLLVYKIVNNGDIPIIYSDFEVPLSISFNIGATILDKEVASTTPKNLKVTLNILDNKIVLEPLLLNSSDSVIINIFLSGYSKGAWTAPEARIVGVNQIEYINESNNIKNINSRLKYVALFTILFICLILIINPLVTAVFLMAILSLLLILHKYKTKIFINYFLY